MPKLKTNRPRPSAFARRRKASSAASRRSDTSSRKRRASVSASCAAPPWSPSRISSVSTNCCPTPERGDPWHELSVASSQDVDTRRSSPRRRVTTSTPQGVPHGEAGGHQGRPVRLPRPSRQEARHARTVDHAHQRGLARLRPELQPPDGRAQEGGLEVDRKMLADLAVHDIEAFGKIAEQAKASSRRNDRAARGRCTRPHRRVREPRRARGAQGRAVRQEGRDHGVAEDAGRPCA